MEGGSLFNPGFLGGSFLWWIGQIADDSTWRENSLPGKFENPQTIPGWGKRYKVRIIGIHDKEDTSIPSSQLPWAQVMYPITAGGGQTYAAQTPNLRHGMFVFGFFLDGQDQQVPVIMGVLGNNAQTKLNQQFTNYGPTSGYVGGENPPQGSAKPGVPDSGKTAVDSTSTPISNPTIEHPDPHQLSAADVKREEKYQEKIPLMKPDDKIGSAIKGIQTVIDNLTKKIDKYLKSLNNYIDAATKIYNTVDDVLKAIKDAACEIAKYIKLIFDKIMEYLLKIINKALAKVVSAMPASLRHLFADIKEVIVELILCLFNKLTQGLCDLINSALNNIIKPRELGTGCNNNVTSPNTPICAAETLVAQVIKYNQKTIAKENEKISNILDSFLGDMQKQFSGVSGLSIPDLVGLVGNITSSISSALSFENLTLNIFGCEPKPNIAVSDFYTFARGGAGQPDSQKPNVSNISDAINNVGDIPKPGDPVPFLEFPKNALDVKLGDSSTQQQIQNRTGSIA
jgi:hypothetical protein